MNSVRAKQHCEHQEAINVETHNKMKMDSKINCWKEVAHKTSLRTSLLLYRTETMTYWFAERKFAVVDSSLNHFLYSMPDSSSITKMCVILHGQICASTFKHTHKICMRLMSYNQFQFDWNVCRRPCVFFSSLLLHCSFISFFHSTIVWCY